MDAGVSITYWEVITAATAVTRPVGHPKKSLTHDSGYSVIVPLSASIRTNTSPMHRAGSLVRSTKMAFRTPPRCGNGYVKKVIVFGY